MVSAIQAMAKAGVYVFPLWLASNLGTSLGGGISNWCGVNVVSLGQAEKEKTHINF